MCMDNLDMLQRLWRCLLLQRGWSDAAGGGAAITRGHTNRRTLAVADHYIAEAWALRPSWQLRWVVPAWRTRVALRRVPRARGPLICFRGRRDDGSIFGFEQVGPWAGTGPG